MAQYEEEINLALAVAVKWYESHRNKRGNVNTNVMTSGLAVAELLADRFPLTEGNITSKQQSQVEGISGAQVKRILARYGEIRQFTAEGGRTSRGTLPLATDLALSLTETLKTFDPDEACRYAIREALQKYFVDCIQQDYFNKQRMNVPIDTDKPASSIVGDILAVAKTRADQSAGIVAQHLVGAKLELRFPEASIGRDKANAADAQTNRQGDFQLGTTAFHVTMAPMAKLVDRARDNIMQGFRPMMLVPEDKVSFAVGLFGSENLDNRVSIQSIETFIGTNIEEMGKFTSIDIRFEVARLIRRYNERIQNCEIDQSLRIEEPAWLIALLNGPTYESLDI